MRRDRSNWYSDAPTRHLPIQIQLLTQIQLDMQIQIKVIQSIVLLQIGWQSEIETHVKRDPKYTIQSFFWQRMHWSTWTNLTFNIFLFNPSFINPVIQYFQATFRLAWNSKLKRSLSSALSSQNFQTIICLKCVWVICLITNLTFWQSLFSKLIFGL